jgi:transposase-like protein
MRSIELDFAQVSVAEKYRVLPQDFKDCFWSDAELKLKEFKKNFLESCLEAEAESVSGASWHERTKDRIAYRNGFRVRKNLKAHGFGDINNFRVPRIRGVLYESKILVKYQRRSIKFDYDILKMYVTQPSTRGIKRIVKQLFGSDLSHATVSTVLQKTQGKLDEWRKKKLTKEYEALVLDGLYIRLRTIPSTFKNKRIYGRYSGRDSQAVILAVMGITAKGVKEILGFKICRSESESDWSGLLNDLVNRGLRLKQDGVIISDGASSISSAVDSIFTYHKKQLCTFHFIHGVSNHIDKLETCKLAQQDLSIVYNSAPNAKTAEKMFWKLISRWKKREPSFARYVRMNFPATLTYFSFPYEKHEAYCTTNYMERTFKEFNRKTYDIGVFPNLYSAERIVFLLVLERNLATTGENPFYALS